MSQDLAAILGELKLDASDEHTREYNAAGVTPKSIATSTQFKSYVCYGITPSDVKQKYTSEEFSFEELEKEFINHCKDYDTPISGTKMKCIDFAIKVIFEAGPQIRSEKKGKGDVMVKFTFPYTKGPDNIQLSVHTVFVSTFRSMEYNKTMATDDNKKVMILTFKQAGLLATKVLVNVAKYLYNLDTTVIFSPLCGAIYSKDDIATMAVELNMEAATLVGILNASCCSGGQNLTESNIACAIAAVISATKKVTDKNIRDSIITKTVKQYSKKNKVYSEKEFLVFCKYALGGVPPGLDAKSLIESFENTQVKEATARAAAKARAESEMRTRTQESKASGSGKKGGKTKRDVAGGSFQGEGGKAGEKGGDDASTTYSA